jgi:hypothetical protein|eukprot:COSAG01_NODE_127_length_24940_cov_140.519923_25_plen_90_part_00
MASLADQTYVVTHRSPQQPGNQLVFTPIRIYHPPFLLIRRHARTRRHPPRTRALDRNHTRAGAACVHYGVGYYQRVVFLIIVSPSLNHK